MQRPALTDQSHINTINQADTLSSDIWNAVIKNVNTASFGKKENLSGDQIRISRIHSRKKLRRYKKVIPVTGGRGIVLVLRGEFGLAKKPRSTFDNSPALPESLPDFNGCPSVNHEPECKAAISFPVSK